MPKEAIKELFQHGGGCAKEGDISRLQANEERIFSCLDRMEKGQERVAEALEKLASQNERINHTEQEVVRLDRNDAEIFKRLNLLETEPAKRDSTFKRDVFLVLSSGAVTLCVTLILKALGVKS